MKTLINELFQFTIEEQRQILEAVYNEECSHGRHLISRLIMEPTTHAHEVMRILRVKKKEFVKELQDKYLGKKIQVRNFTGECEFIGYNSFIPSWGLQITMGRLPITNVELEEIKLIT